MKKYLHILIFAFFILFIFFIHLNTMHPVFKNNDSPETSSAAFTLGIGHPPGYPLFTMAAKIFTLILPGNVAFKVNLFSSFLFVLIIIFTFLILKRYILFNFKQPLYFAFAISLLSILSFGYIFWNQAIEAKGGIYILNLLFFSIFIFLCLELIEKINIKFLYLLTFIYALSLSNHLPSMAILFPVYLFFIIKYFKELKLKNYLIIILFFIIGISPYLFLYLRAKTEPVLNWGNPSNLNNLFWVIFRKGYVYPVKYSFNVVLYQVKEFIRFFLTNFWIFWIFSIPGTIFLYKRQKRFFYFYLTLFLIIVIAVVFYNRTKEELLWQMDIFLMPAEYVVFIFIALGLFMLFEKIKHLIYKTGLVIFIFFIIFIYASKNFYKNNFSEDYLLYDYGYNVLNTLNNGNCYIGDGDYNLMPIYYIQEIQKKRKDVKFVTVSFLIFQWGIDDFIKRYGYVEMKPFATNENILNIIDKFSKSTDVFISNYFPRFEGMKLNYEKNQKGLLFNLSKEKRIFSSKIFLIYSYRGIFKKFCKENKINRDLIGWYPASMVNQANELSGQKNFDEAIYLYKKALLFPVEKPEANIYYNIALAYKLKGDLLNYLINLLKAAKITENKFILKEAGILCYEIGLFEIAKEIFKNLLKNEKEENIIKIYESLNNLTPEQINEMTLAKANEFINTMPDIARYLYEYLLEKNYKIGIIYRNLGVYYFKTCDFDKALGNFVLSKNETPNPEIYAYIAFTYYKKGNKRDALDIVKLGLKLYRTDRQLNDLFIKLKNEVNK